MLTAEFLGNLCVGLIVVLLGGAWVVQKLHAKNKDLKATCSKQAKEIQALEAQGTHIEQQLRQYYDERAEGDDHQMTNAKAMDAEWRNFVIHLVKEIERLEPGWCEKRGFKPPE